MDECIQYLEQIHKEVTAALIIAAKEMRSRGPHELSYTFHKDNLVLFFFFEIDLYAPRGTEPHIALLEHVHVKL